jgi:hypothetical protein
MLVHMRSAFKGKKLLCLFLKADFLPKHIVLTIKIEMAIKNYLATSLKSLLLTSLRSCKMADFALREKLKLLRGPKG